MPRTWEGRRRNVTITLCGDRRGRTPMHTVAVGGRDPEAATALEREGLSELRPAKSGSRGWRYESCLQGLRRGDGGRGSHRVSAACPTSGRSRRLGRSVGSGESNSLPFIQAQAVRPGMVMFGEDGGYDIVESVESVPLEAPVYDLDIESTHNFVANGLVTLKSIYGFRGADITQHPEFRGRLRRRPRGPARAELPLDADDPERRERRRVEQPRPQGQVAVDRDRRGQPDQGARARRRARRGALRRRRDRAARRRGRVALRDRRLLPHQHAVAGDGGHAGPGADRLPGDRRHEVLRAGGDQGRGRLPHVPGQPRRRRRVHADRQLAQARDRADVALARARATRRRWASRRGRRPRTPRACRRSARRRSARSGASCRRWSG